MKCWECMVVFYFEICASLDFCFTKLGEKNFVFV